MLPRLRFDGLSSARPHLSVDGLSPDGPNLSHWPGNRTPRAFRADLSTGICLRFLAAPEPERAAFLGGVEAVVNDHYDSDGWLSLLAVTRPEVVLERAELCLAVAATGDFQVFTTRRACAVDRIVLGLGDAERSPLGPGPVAAEDRYRWLLEHAPLVLDRPEELRDLWADDVARIEEDLRAGLEGDVERRLHPRQGLSVLETGRDFDRVALNTLAGAYRVLHAERTASGTRYRYWDRVESWFDVVTIAPPRRVDLRPLARRLSELEGGSGPHAWHADPPTAPVPEIWFGEDAPQRPGRVTRVLGESVLGVEAVRAELCRFLEDPGR